jgi:hypothetical protein
MLYRYLSLLFLVLLLSACQKVFSSGRYPKEMPPLSKFENQAMGYGGCGFVETYSTVTIQTDKSEGKSEVWGAYYKEDESYPYLVFHTYTKQSWPVLTELWVYKSANGAGEFYDNKEKFDHKFYQPCQAIGGILGAPRRPMKNRAMS